MSLEHTGAYRGGDDVMHEFRSSPSGVWICAGCGRPYATCRGLKPVEQLRKLLNARLEEVRDVMGYPEPVAESLPGYRVPRAPWKLSPEALASISTPDALRRAEECLARVALLRLEAGDDPARREAYASWKAYDEATARMSYEARDVQSRAEVAELERWARL